MPNPDALVLEPHTVDIVVARESRPNSSARERIAEMASPTVRVEEQEGKLVAIATFTMPPFLMGEPWSWYGTRPDRVFYEAAHPPRPLGEIEEDGEVTRLALRELRKEEARLEAALTEVQHRITLAAGDGGKLRDLHAEWLQRQRWDEDGDRPPVVVEVPPGSYPNRKIRLDLMDPAQVVVVKVTKATITLKRRGENDNLYDFKRSDGSNPHENARLVDPEKAVADFQAWGRVNRAAKKA